MRVLYGVNGEGMGHATRSRVVIEELLERHDVRVVASGAAFRYLSERLPRVDEVFGPSFAMQEGEIQRWQTVLQNVRNARRDMPETVRNWISTVDEWKPEIVLTDFEPLAGMFARVTRTPMIAIDNINMLDRCRHDAEIVGDQREDFLMAKAVTRSMVPGAVEYIVLTFFRSPVARGGTTLVPPIVRPEIISAVPERGEHLVVYSSGDPRLLEDLAASGVPCRIYGMRDDAPEDRVEAESLDYRPRSNEGFVDDLRTSRGVVAGGGFSLLSEAVYLGKPVLAIPLRGQFEQMMNARYLERDGYGLCAPVVTREILGEFLERLGEFERALAGYEQEGNSVTLKTIEQHAIAVAAAQPRALRRERRGARKRTAR